MNLLQQAIAARRGRRFPSWAAPVHPKTGMKSVEPDGYRGPIAVTYRPAADGTARVEVMFGDASYEDFELTAQQHEEWRLVLGLKGAPKGGRVKNRDEARRILHVTRQIAPKQADRPS